MWTVTCVMFLLLPKQYKRRWKTMQLTLCGDPLALKTGPTSPSPWLSQKSTNTWATVSLRHISVLVLVTAAAGEECKEPGLLPCWITDCLNNWEVCVDLDIVTRRKDKNQTICILLYVYTIYTVCIYINIWYPSIVRWIPLPRWLKVRYSLHCAIRSKRSTVTLKNSKIKRDWRKDCRTITWQELTQIGLSQV